MQPDQEIRHLKRLIQEQNKKIASLNRRDAEKETRLRDLEDKDKDQDYQIKKIDDKLTEISGDTTFIRQKITGALIVAAAGGIVGLFFFMVQFLLTN